MSIFDIGHMTAGEMTPGHSSGDNSGEGLDTVCDGDIISIESMSDEDDVAAVFRSDEVTRPEDRLPTRKTLAFDEEITRKQHAPRAPRPKASRDEEWEVTSINAFFRSPSESASERSSIESEEAEDMALLEAIFGKRGPDAEG